MASDPGAQSRTSQPTFASALADRTVAGVSDEETDENRAADDDNPPDVSKLKARPTLAHHLQNDSSILALAVGERYIYAGTQDGDILVWSLASFELVNRIQAHTRAVLCLFLSADGELLFSGAGDAIVNAWHSVSLKLAYHIYSTYDVGDVFSVVYSAQFQTVYLGAQNTSIQWCTLKDCATRPTPNPERHPDRRNHRFFDSVQAGGTLTPRPATTRTGINEGNILEIDKAHMMHYAHYGYVYCMLLVRGVSRLMDADEDMLISGGGDGTIKLWQLFHNQNQGIKEVACLGVDDAESVLSLAVDGSFLYSSKLDGVIELWDLDTEQKVRVIKAHRGDVMTLQMGWGYLWSGGATGFARVSFRAYILRVMVLTSLRNTALCSMASTKALRHTLARNTTASIDGRLMKAASWRPLSLHTTSSSCTSQGATITQSRFGISRAATLVLMASKKFMRTSLSNPCRSSFHSRLSLLGQIMPRIVGAAPPFCGPCSRSTAPKPRC
jgi:di- and tripeptidase